MHYAAYSVEAYSLSQRNDAGLRGKGQDHGESKIDNDAPGEAFSVGAILLACTLVQEISQP